MLGAPVSTLWELVLGPFVVWREEGADSGLWSNEPVLVREKWEHEAGHRLIALSSGLAGRMQTKCVLSKPSRIEPAAEAAGKYLQSTRPWALAASPARPGGCFWSGSQLCREWATRVVQSACGAV